MRIAFLGLGRMGRELVRHLLAGDTFEVTVWNRTAAVAEPLRAEGAAVAASPAEAVAGAEVVVTCLFGPEAVRQVVIESGAGAGLAAGSLWIDISTVGPAAAGRFAVWAQAHAIRYVHAPVLGSLGPARAGDLGVLIGGTDPVARAAARRIVAVWADPARIIEYDSAGAAATGKLVVNYGLAVGVQALAEALRLGQAGGLSQADTIALLKLPKTPLSVIAGMKADLIAGSAYADTQFSTNLLAKDVDLMLTVAAGQALPALTAAFASLEHARRAGHGEDDFAAMAGGEPSPTSV